MPPKKRGLRTLRRVKSANTFLRKHRVISRGATLVSKVGPKKHRRTAAKTAQIARQLGYGLKLAGSGRKAVKKKRRRVGRPCGK